METITDPEGYFLVRLRPEPDRLTSPSTTASVELASPYRGLTEPHTTTFEVSVPGPEARFGVISDVDDTILETGVQRVGRMLKQTFTGSALTRTPFEGAPELYQDLAAGVNPVFYVSSSPWNLHAFLIAFLDHRAFPRGPVLLRDLLGGTTGREQKSVRLHEILDLHPGLRFVLLGDSGEHDPQIYAELVRSYPGRVIAVYIREVRLDPGDGRVETGVGGVGRRRGAVRARGRQRRRTPARRGAGSALGTRPGGAVGPADRPGGGCHRRGRDPLEELGRRGLPHAEVGAPVAVPVAGHRQVAR